ncbi:hypothetical protein STCU_10770 [Strigomonas culicis]|uniref:Uncharacterized protein n=1 Tax=Strigomonas culicis TaxID=28005 RepID=S9V305_9TRYP|nr:hypothetical protein STCU_10770 [Strigomonas culicis]|eukprot:EPY17185.1 hypothetical protein STCU_10770 [Strigomonas culicis]
MASQKSAPEGTTGRFYVESTALPSVKANRTFFETATHEGDAAPLMRRHTAPHCSAAVSKLESCQTSPGSVNALSMNNLQLSEQPAEDPPVSQKRLSNVVDVSVIVSPLDAAPCQSVASSLSFVSNDFFREAALQRALQVAVGTDGTDAEKQTAAHSVELLSLSQMDGRNASCSNYGSRCLYYSFTDMPSVRENSLRSMDFSVPVEVSLPTVSEDGPAAPIAIAQNTAESHPLPSSDPPLQEAAGGTGLTRLSSRRQSAVRFTEGTDFVPGFHRKH